MSPHGREIEIKLPVADIAEVRRRLGELRAARGARFHEVNAVFDTPEQSLRRRGQLLRVRVERGRSTPQVAPERGARSGRVSSRVRLIMTMLFPPNGEQRALVTLKAPVKGRIGARMSASEPHRGGRGNYKIRREIEFVVPDAGAFRTVLGYLGYQPAFYYEKLRTVYRLPRLKGVIVALDETPIGTFIELEGRPRDIDRARTLLGFKAREAILLSYGALYAASQRARGLPFHHMLFG